MILHGLSCGVTLIFIYSIFFKDRIKLSLKYLMIFSVFFTANFMYPFAAMIPGFMLSILDPVISILLLSSITKRKYYDLVLLRITSMFILMVVEIIAILAFAAFNILDDMIPYGYHIGTVIYPLAIPIAYFFRKQIQSFADKLLNIDIRQKEKNIIVFMMLHLSFVIIKFVIDDYHNLTGDYVNTGIIFVVLFYILVIYMVSMKHIRKNKKESSETLHAISSENRKNILASTYSAIHDARNVMQSVRYVNNDDDILNEVIPSRLFSSLLTSKIKHAKNSDIELIIEYRTDKVVNFEDHSLSELNFTIIFGILIDNAVEHLKSHKELLQEIKVEIGEDLNLKVSNSIHESAIGKIHLFDSFGYSSKEKSNSGYGLYNASNIAKESEYKLEMISSDKEITLNLISA